MKNRFFVVAVMLAVIVGFCACGGNGDDKKSSACDIVTFEAYGDRWHVSTGAGTANSPLAIYPTKANAQKEGALNSLAATISASPKANVSPSPPYIFGNDGKETVDITVTAEDGTKKYYRASALVQLQ